MARQLWLLRHAEAEPHGTRTDAARRLTVRGQSQARAAGLALMRMRASFEVVMFSSRARARETAELAFEEWGERCPSLRVHPALADDFDAEQALEAVSPLSASAHALFVGHEPHFAGVIAQLTGARVDLKKGGLAVVRLGRGSARLDGVAGELTLLMRPRELALIAGQGRRAVSIPALAEGAPLGG